MSLCRVLQLCGEFSGSKDQLELQGCASSNSWCTWQPVCKQSLQLKKTYSCRVHCGRHNVLRQSKCHVCKARVQQLLQPPSSPCPRHSAVMPNLSPISTGAGDDG